MAFKLKFIFDDLTFVINATDTIEMLNFETNENHGSWIYHSS